MKDVVIVSGVRTAQGKFDGAIKDFSAPKLGSIVIKEAVKRAEIEPKDVDEVIMGCVVAAGLGQNVARQAAIGAGIPYEAGALHIDKVCGSSLKAVVLAAQAIKCDDAEIIVAGGMESMSNCPYTLPKARYGYKMFDDKVVDLMVNDGLWDIYNNFHMGMTGEIIAEKYGITRQMADELSYASHKNAVAAIKSGRFKDEIVPVDITVKGTTTQFTVDEGPR